MNDLDIFFLSFSESNAEENWRHLSSRFPRAKRVHGIKGVKNAHKVVAAQSTTPFFFLIDGDNRVADGFDFTIDFKPRLDTLYVWRAINPVNGLCYGFGAMKLYNRDILTRTCDGKVVDVATTVAPKYHIIHSVASTTHFNASPLEAWRGAFRESAKLQLNCFKNPADMHSYNRLETWTSKGEESLHGTWALLGARQGREFARAHWQNLEAMAQINDFDWLDSIFKRATDNTGTSSAENILLTNQTLPL
jgi:hypothetical protein